MTAPWEDRPKKAIDIFYEFYGNHFDELHSTYQVILKKRTAQQTKVN